MADASTQQQQQPMNFLATLKNNKSPQQNGTGMRLCESIYPLSALSLSFLLARESNRMDCLSVFRPAKDFARSSLFTHRFSLSFSFKQENNNNKKERRPRRPGLHHHPDNNNRRRGQRRFWGRSRLLGKRRQRRRRRVAARRNQHRLASRKKRKRRSTRA